ncbi:MAG: hypothetical protein Q4E03_04790 [Trueperella sp.]|nr:hypothetical protein [Trueperella sp.]
MKTKLGVVIGALLIVLGFGVMPAAVAAPQQWESVSSSRASLGGLRSTNEPIAICTGDTQLNFLYHGQLGKNADFATVSVTAAGQPYRTTATERGWNSNISAANTGTMAAVLDLWGSREFAAVPIEAFTLATRLLSEDPRAASVSKNAVWNMQAQQIIAAARKIAGPHTAGKLTVKAAATNRADEAIEVTGFTVSGAAGVALSGIPFRAKLSGGIWQKTGNAELSGTTTTGQQSFMVIPDGFGAVAVDLEFTNLPGTQFRTGHHAIAQDMHMRGTRGTVTAHTNLRESVPGPEVLLSTQAQMVDGKVVDTVSVTADDWPVFGAERAQFEMTANLYGPFDLPQEQQEQVPAGSPLADTATLVVTDPGEYPIEFAADERPAGWYTVVVTGQFRTEGNFAQLDSTPIVMPFFEPAETVVEKTQPHIVTVAAAMEKDGEIFLTDRVEISGFAENHGEWLGSADWAADATLKHELHFIPTLEAISDADITSDTLIHAVEIPTVNGVQEISAPEFKVDKERGVGTYVFITRFPGDERVAAFATSAAEKSEQYRYQPAVPPSYPELPETGALTMGLGALGLGITGLGISALRQKKQQ